jgi:hypothetical protein
MRHISAEKEIAEIRSQLQGTSKSLGDFRTSKLFAHILLCNLWKWFAMFCTNA